MRFDMHCHTREGSIDGKIALPEYVSRLKAKGYQGMLLTEHNSYRSYQYYRLHRSQKIFQNFMVLRGIEYDTCDGGHILVIMPDFISLPILTLRGLPVAVLIQIVHLYGGILGPAHPCGEKYMSLCRTKYYRKNPSVLKQFDFMETFNACETDAVNLKATRLAWRYRLLGLGGSDSHRAESIGCAYTDLPDFIRSESDLIAYIRKKAPVCCGGYHFPQTLRSRIGRLNFIFVQAFRFYNKAASLLYRHKRRLALSRLYTGGSHKSLSFNSR